MVETLLFSGVLTNNICVKTYVYRCIILRAMCPGCQLYVWHAFYVWYTKRKSGTEENSVLWRSRNQRQAFTQTTKPSNWYRKKRGMVVRVDWISQSKLAATDHAFISWRRWIYFRLFLLRRSRRCRRVRRSNGKKHCGIAQQNFKLHKSKRNTFVHVINYSGVQERRCAEDWCEGMNVRLVTTGIASNTSG